MNQSSQWKKEYKKKGIPSSFRETPSGSAKWYYRILKKNRKIKGKLLDLGCGKGRNAIFFAEKGFEVYGIDFVKEALEEMEKKAGKKNLEIKAFCRKVEEKMPFPNNFFDAAIDIFCYPHIESKKKQEKYRKELQRVLKETGTCLLSLASDRDGFYSKFLGTSPEPKNKKIIDPIAHVSKYLYSLEDLEKEFSNEFKIVNFQEKNKKDFMHGRDYARTTLSFILQKKGN